MQENQGSRQRASFTAVKDRNFYLTQQPSVAACPSLTIQSSSWSLENYVSDLTCTRWIKPLTSTTVPWIIFFGQHVGVPVSGTGHASVYKTYSRWGIQTSVNKYNTGHKSFPFFESYYMNKPNNQENVTSSQSNFQNSQTTQGKTSETRPGMKLESGPSVG